MNYINERMMSRAARSYQVFAAAHNEAGVPFEPLEFARQAVLANLIVESQEQDEWKTGEDFKDDPLVEVGADMLLKITGAE